MIEKQAQLPIGKTNGELEKHRAFFDASPISLWEEDFSQAKQYIVALQAEGITDLRAYFDAHPEAVRECLRLVRIIDVNQATLNLFEARTKQDLIENLGTFLGTESLAIFKEELIAVGEGRTLLEAEGSQYTLSGKKIYVQVRWLVVPGHEALCDRVMISLLDITKRRESEISLRQQSYFLQSLLDNIPSPVYYKDKTGEFQSCNKAFTIFSGRSQDEIIGKTVYDLGPRDLADTINQQDQELLTKGGTQIIENNVVSPAGEPRNVIFHKAAVNDVDGNSVGLVGIIVDITERKNMEVQLRRQLHEEELLGEVMTQAVTAVDFTKAVENICARLAQFYQVPKAAFAMLNEAGTEAKVIAEYRELDQPTSIDALIPVMGNPSMEHILTHKTPLAVTDAQNDPLLAPINALMRQHNIASILIIPILIAGEVVGTMGFDSPEIREFSEDDLALGVRVGMQISQLLQQKQAADELRQAKEYAELLFRVVPSAIFTINNKGVITSWNQRAAEITGYVAEEVIGQKCTMFALEPCTRKCGLFTHNIIKPISNSECTIRTKDGRTLSVLKNADLLRDADGNVTGGIESFEDITARKQMETRLRQQVLREELITQIATRLTSDADLDSILTDICRLLTQHYRLSHATFAFVNKEAMHAEVAVRYQSPNGSGSIIPIVDIAPLEFVTAADSPLVIVDAQQEPQLAPVHDLIREIGIVSVLLVPILMEGEIIGVLEFDSRQQREFDQEEIFLARRVATKIGQAIVTERSKQELQTERDFAQQVMNNMGQGLAVINAQWHVEYCNPAGSQLLGYTTAELIGKSLHDLTFPAEHPMIDALQARGLREDRRTYELPLKRADGSAVHVLITAVPRWQKNQLTGAIAVLTDLTKRKETEAALASARDQAVEASRLKSEFLANMSHEIRTPLNAIIGMTSLLLDTDLVPEQQDFAQTIRNSGDILLSLINDILDFSKIEAGKMELEERPFNLRDSVEEALDVLASRASEKGLEIAYTFAKDVPAIIISDVTRLRQVLVNLLSNAIKFTDEGEVVVRVDSRPAVKENEGDLPIHNVHFAVQDTGIGISPQQRDRLFKTFSQVDASTTRKYGGSGLGLAISKRLVEMMGGEIWVESELEVGSTFHFTITAAAKQETPSEKMSNHRLLNGKQVLIVDDNKTNRFILARQTQLWGMKPTTAASGEDALDIIERDTPLDLAILDMQMPEMDGQQLAYAIRRHRDENSLPLIMLSSIGFHEKEEDNPFAAFLTKPIKPLQLFNTLTNLFAETAVTPSHPPNIPTQIDEEMAQRHPLQILLAEDNLVNQKVALRILERMGYRADLAANGIEVLEALHRQPYDVILMDVQMPEMDGVEATNCIREDWPKEQQPRIIAMTAHALSGDRERYLEAGMDDYISKPVHIEELMAALARSQSRGQRQDSTASNTTINQAVFTQLQEDMGEDADEIVADLVTMFSDNGPAAVQAMRQAIDQNDAAELDELAHALKGSSATLGASALTALCQRMETAAHEDDLDLAAHLLPQIDDEVNRALAAFQALLQPETG